MKYISKPIVIKAIMWNGNNLKEVMEFIGSEFTYEEKTNYLTNKFTYHCNTNRLAINALAGTMKVSKGDFIIKGVKGEFYTCKPYIFKETYEKILEGDEQC